MATNKLVAYWIRLRDRGSDDRYWDLSEMYRHEPKIYYNDIVDLFEDFCRANSRKTYIDDENDETLRIDFFERDGNIIEGEFSKGDTGLIADHYDTEEDRREVLARQENISEEIPYYFLFYRLSNNSDRALLILREYGGKGAKRAITNLLKPAIRGVTKQGIYEDSAVITENARRAINQADRVASLKLEGEEQLRAIDQVAKNENVEEKESQKVAQTIHIKPENEGFHPDILDSFFDTSVKYAGYKLEEYDDAKLTVEQDGSELTFSIFNPQVDLRMVLSNKNVEFEGQHPTPETISKMGRKFVNEIIDEYDDGTIETDAQLDSSLRKSAKKPPQSEDKGENDNKQTKLSDTIPSPQAAEEDD